MPAGTTKIYTYPRVVANYPSLAMGTDLRSLDSGATVLDESLNRNNLTVLGSPTFSDSVLGRTVSLVSGSSQRLRITDSGSGQACLTPLNNSGQTIIVICKRTRANGSSEALVTKYAPGGYEYVFGTYLTTLYYWVYQTSTAAYIGRSVVSSVWPNDGLYHFLVARWTGGTGATTCSIWIDNLQVDTTSLAVGLFSTVQDGSTSLYVGYASDGIGPAYATVDISQVQMFNRALTTQEMTNLYSAFLATKIANLYIARTKISVGSPALTLTEAAFPSPDPAPPGPWIGNYEGIIAAWDMENTAGSVIDLASDHDAVVNGAPNFTTESFGKVAEFDGTCSLTVPDHVDLSATRSVVVVVENFSDFGSFIFNKHNGSDQAEFKLCVDGMALQWLIYDNSMFMTKIGRSCNSSFLPIDGNYHVVIATWDGVDEAGMKIYVDNVRVDDTSASSGPFSSQVDTTADVQMACWNSMSPTINLGSVRLYDRVLTVDEMNELYTLLLDLS